MVLLLTVLVVWSFPTIAADITVNYDCIFGEGCLFQCHCHGNTLCNNVTGSCPDGCAHHDDHVPRGATLGADWSGPGCQIGNVGYRQEAHQLSSQFDKDADLAVDGRFSSTRYCPYVDSLVDMVAMTYPGQQHYERAWWRVDLGTLHRILRVIVKVPSGYLGPAYDDLYPVLYVEVEIGDGNTYDRCRPMNNCEPYPTTTYGPNYVRPSVGTPPVWTTPNHYEGSGYEGSRHEGSGHYRKKRESEAIQEVHINDYDLRNISRDCQHIPGAHRYVRLEDDSYMEWPKMLLCEVQIIGYQYHACSGNTFGPGCITPCNCHSKCHTITGQCPSHCIPGWEGSNCQLRCSATRWGASCNMTCNCQDHLESCFTLDGHCASGCRRGYSGVGCDQREDNSSQSYTTTSGYDQTSNVLDIEPDDDPPPMLIEKESEDVEAWKIMAGAAGGILLINGVATLILAIVVCRRQKDNFKYNPQPAKKTISRLSSNSSQMALVTGIASPIYSDFIDSRYDTPSENPYAELGAHHYYTGLKLPTDGAKKTPLRRTDSKPANHRYITPEEQIAGRSPPVCTEEGFTINEAYVTLAPPEDSRSTDDGYLEPLGQHGTLREREAPTDTRPLACETVDVEHQEQQVMTEDGSVGDLDNSDGYLKIVK